MSLQPIGNAAEFKLRDTVCGCGAPLKQVKLHDARGERWAPDQCDSCIERREARERETSADATKLAHRFAALQVPRSYRGVTFDDFDAGVLETADAQTTARLRRLARAARVFCDRFPTAGEDPDFPHVVIMRGTPGTGKTLLAWMMVQELTRTLGATCVVSTLADAIRDVREAWRRDDGPSERARISRYRNADLLVLDEVSQHALYGEPTQALYDLIAPREADRRPTILTTNELGATFDALIGPALTSRAAGSGGVWDFGTTDYRLARAASRRAARTTTT